MDDVGLTETISDSDTETVTLTTRVVAAGTFVITVRPSPRTTPIAALTSPIPITGRYKENSIGYEDARRFYSPAVCPQGLSAREFFTEEWNTMHESLLAGETAAMCCPSEFHYPTEVIRFDSPGAQQEPLYCFKGNVQRNLYTEAFQIRWQQSDIDDAILLTHPMTPGKTLTKKTAEVVISTSTVSTQTVESTAVSDSSSSAPAVGDNVEPAVGDNVEPAEASEPGLSQPAKIGIAVGASVFFLLLLAFIFFFFRRRARRNRAIAEAESGREGDLNGAYAQNGMVDPTRSDPTSSLGSNHYAELGDQKDAELEGIPRSELPGERPAELHGVAQYRAMELDGRGVNTDTWDANKK